MVPTEAEAAILATFDPLLVAADWENSDDIAHEVALATIRHMLAYGEAERQRLQERVRALEARRAEVRQRTIKDHYTGTSPDSGHWWTCRLCDWIWKHGGPESHEPDCPAAEEKP